MSIELKWIVGKPTSEGWYLVLLDKNRKYRLNAYEKAIPLHFDGTYCGKWHDVCYHINIDDIPTPEGY